MKYVYILESLDAEHFYVGIADDVAARLVKHNAGDVPHTSNIDLGDSTLTLLLVMKSGP
jgi:predicted GIY-YIG superfamily endonuclease